MPSSGALRLAAPEVDEEALRLRALETKGPEPCLKPLKTPCCELKLSRCEQRKRTGRTGSRNNLLV